MFRIKEKLLAFYARRCAKQDRAVRTNVGFREARAIGILYSLDSPEKHEPVRHLAERLTKLGKRVEVLCYEPGLIQTPDLPYPTIMLRDIKLWGKIDHPQAQDFINRPFDYLYHVDLVKNPVVDFFLAKCQAKCRVGHYEEDRASFFEIMVTFNRREGRNDIGGLIEQMVHYTQPLNPPSSDGRG